MTTPAWTMLRNLLLVTLVAPALAAGQVDCSDPDELCTGDPCVIGSVTVAPSCVVSFGTRAVVVEGPLLVPGGGTLALSAGTITLDGRIAISQPPAGATDGADVELVASDDVLVYGTIRTTALDSTGDITIVAGRDVAVAGTLRAATAVAASPGAVVVEAGGTVHVASSIVTRGNYSPAGSVTLRGDAGVILERPLDTSAGRGQVSADEGGHVRIESSAGPVTITSKIDTRGAVAGSVTVTAASTIAMNGKIMTDATCPYSCRIGFPNSGEVTLRATGGDVDIAGRISARQSRSSIITIEAAGQARVRGAIDAKARAPWVEPTIAVAADHVSLEAPARLDVTSRESGGTVRLMGGTVWVGPRTTVRAGGREGEGDVYITATTGDAIVSGLVIADGDDVHFSSDTSVIELTAAGDLTANGTFRSTRHHRCLAMRAGGTLDSAAASVDIPIVTDCPGDATFCGDGIATGTELCDGRDECAADLGLRCSFTCTACQPVCGDGIVAGPEVCDGSAGCAPGTQCNGSCSACEA